MRLEPCLRQLASSGAFGLVLLTALSGPAHAREQQMAVADQIVTQQYSSVTTQSRLLRERDEEILRLNRRIAALESQLEAQGSNTVALSREIVDLKRTVIQSLQEDDPEYARAITDYGRVLAFLANAPSAEVAFARLSTLGEAGRRDIQMVVDQTANLTVDENSDVQLVLLRATALSVLAETDRRSRAAVAQFTESVDLLESLARYRPGDDHLWMMLYATAMRTAVSYQELNDLDGALRMAARAEWALQATPLQSENPRDWYYWKGQTYLFYAHLFMMEGQNDRASDYVDLAVLSNEELRRYDYRSRESVEQTAMVAELVRLFHPQHRPGGKGG